MVKKSSGRTINVDEILEGTERSTKVEKEIPLTLDLGSLIACDLTAVNPVELNQNKEQYLEKITRDNTQILFNALFNLPTGYVDKMKCVQLPKPTTRLPREKPIPKPKAPTKWEAFAKKKGIQKKKKGRMVWDDIAKEWRPRHGYKRIGSDKEQNWVVEIPDNATDPYKDYIAEREDKKKEKSAKNELQRLQNIARANPQTKARSEELSQTVKQAHLATASLGRFTDTVANEKKAKAKGKHQKFAPVTGNATAEKDQSLKLINKITSKTVTVDKAKAADMELGNVAKRKRKDDDMKKNGRRSKAGTKPQAKHFDKKKGKVAGPPKKKIKR